jgi:glycosyltransferase involved in cell wall biosynthesis
MAAAALAGVPVRVASKRETSGMRTTGQRFVERAAFNRANAVIANSDAVRIHLAERGLNGSKVRLIHNGIILDRFADVEISRQELCDKYALPAADTVRFVTLVANLRHGVKNIPMLLRVARRVVEVHPNAHFVIAGEGGLETELKRQAIELGVKDSIHFIGRCTNVPAMLHASYACVLTSSAEGFSNSILEYMAAGRPVVATNVGGAAEAVVDGANGYLVNSDDDAGMAHRLIELLNDEEKATTFGKEGKQRIAARFTAEAQLMSTIELYRSLLNRN